MKNLKTQLVLLAERAGYTVREDVFTWNDGKYDHPFPTNHSRYTLGKLTGNDVEVVLGWLAKAGYWVEIPWADLPQDKYEVSISSRIPLTIGEQKFEADESGDTFGEALEAAILALDIPHEV